MESFDTLTAADGPAVAGLCARASPDPPPADDLVASLFDPTRPALVRGDPERGLAATVERNGQAYLRLLVVDRGWRRRGLGSALLAAAEADVADQGMTGTVVVGTDAPDFLYPGVDSRQTDLLCLLEKHGYDRVSFNFNMAVDLTRLPPDPGGTEVGTDADREELEAFLSRSWPMWADEALRGLAKGKLLLARDAQGIAGFCAWDVNWAGKLGPMAGRSWARGQGVGRKLVLGALHRMRAAGRSEAEIVWVAPLRFYAKAAGAVVNRVFFVYRKRLGDADGHR
ncbi:MAG TPA: GNAT family N-acetyltransferase [Acidimicrobiales bacterium]|nr:GNAT family N-acetyltransferase [Acidimicrobiales bacterium]